MKKILLLVLIYIITFCLASTNNNEETKENIDIQYVYATQVKDFKEEDLINEFDFSFVGEVVEYISTSQYNGYGTDIPYSYFTVRIIDRIKGNVEDNIVIKFYGGYNTNNVLTLLEDMEYPEINEKYLFYCNKTNYSYEEDGRTINNSYVVLMKPSMTNIKELTAQVKNNILENNSRGGIISPDVFVEDEGGGYINTTFANADTINMNGSKYVYLHAGEERYYKINTTALNYLSVYSTGTIDTLVKIYDSNLNLIAESDDINVTDAHAMLYYSSNQNFFANFYTNKNETYYFKVKSLSTFVPDGITLHLIQDNWYVSSNITNLFINEDAVDGNSKIDYTLNTKYLSEMNHAFNEWNKLETISFSPDSNQTINDLNVVDMYDAEFGTPIGATTINVLTPSIIRLNTFYLDNMTQNERICICLHELGHTLGLGEFTYYENEFNVMHQSSSGLNKLGPADIAAYRAKWDN